MTWGLKVIAGMVLALGTLTGGTAASAQESNDGISCGHYDTQEGAQAALDELATDDPWRDSLDGDGDGIACEDATHIVECSEFASQEEAQAFVDRWAEGTGFPNLEDDDSDGLYCETYFGTETGDGGEEAPTGDGIAVNAIACDVPECTDGVSIDGAVVTTYYDNGDFADECTTSTDADDFDGCVLLIPASGGDVRFDLPTDYAGYEQVSAIPDIYEGREGGGPTYVYTFVPADATGEGADEDPATVDDTDAVDDDEDTDEAVMSLPSTGAGEKSQMDPARLADTADVVGLLAIASGARLRRGRVANR